MKSKKRTTVGSGKRKQTTPATPRFNPQTLLTQIGEGRTILDYKEGQTIFAQGDAAEAIFYIQKGRVKLTVVSKPGREAVLALLGPGDFFGESSLHSSALLDERGGGHQRINDRSRGEASHDPAASAGARLVRTLHDAFAVPQHSD